MKKEKTYKMQSMRCKRHFTYDWIILASILPCILIVIGSIFVRLLLLHNETRIFICFAATLKDVKMMRHLKKQDKSEMDRQNVEKVLLKYQVNKFEVKMNVRKKYCHLLIAWKKWISNLSYMSYGLLKEERVRWSKKRWEWI